MDEASSWDNQAVSRVDREGILSRTSRAVAGTQKGTPSEDTLQALLHEAQHDAYFNQWRTVVERLRHSTEINDEPKSQVPIQCFG